MAPFIVNHPTLLNNWILAKETVLKKIREIKNVDPKELELFRNCLIKSQKNIENWKTESEFQIKKINELKIDLEKFSKYLNNQLDINKEYLFNDIYIWAENNLTDEGVEYIVSLMMEPYDHIVKPMINEMSSYEDEYFEIPTIRTIQELRNILENNYSEILKIDFSDKESNQNFWFISKNKEEPRLADRYLQKGLN